MVATVVLWVRTELLRYTYAIAWGPGGTYRCVELSGDDLKYKVLRQPGLPPTPAGLVVRRGGWLPRPPPPVDPAALPAGSVTWVLPQPNGTFAPTRYGGAVTPAERVVVANT